MKPAASAARAWAGKNFLQARNLKRRTADRWIELYEQSIGLRAPKPHLVVDRLSTTKTPSTNPQLATNETQALQLVDAADLAVDATPAQAASDEEEFHCALQTLEKAARKLDPDYVRQQVTAWLQAFVDKPVK
jgi:hypothetical protein